MVIETALLLGGAIVTAALGVPIVSRLGQPTVGGRHEPRDTTSHRKVAESRTTFEPLDLGPDLMKWPSEVARPNKGIREPLWPSQTWDDPHFGSHWKKHAPPPPRDDGGDPTAQERRTVQQLAAATAATVKKEANELRSKARQEAREVKARAEELRQSAQEHAPKLSRDAAKQIEKAREKVENVVRREVQDARQVVHQEVREATERVADHARQRAQAALDQVAAIGVTGAPSAAEIEKMVSTVGLAGTVQTIMQRTGWDFRQAAQYLAKARQGG